MTWFEWIGSVAIVLYLYELYKNIRPAKFSKDSEFERRQHEFDRMGEAFGRLYDVRDQDADPHNENISNVQSTLDIVIHSTGPLSKDSFASDYRSKYVDYCALANFASAIIESELKGKSITVPELSIK